MRTKILIMLLAVAAAVNAQTIEGGFKHTLALCSEKSVMAWGHDVSGQLGNGTNLPYVNTPVAVSGLTGIVAVSGGYYHSVALKDDGTVWTWGDNDYGQLGNGTNTDSNVPVQAGSLSGIKAVAAGFSHTMALKDDGTVWVWGYNGYNQFGNGNATDSNIPVQIPALTGIKAIAAGGYHSIVLKNDNTVWAFGYNLYGQLGSGNTDETISVPVQALTLTGISSIAAGTYHSFALNSEGALWTWGFNVYGQLGNGNNTNSNVPVRISSMSNVKEVAGGEHHTVALRTDGTVWSWGWNSAGQLGAGTNDNSNIPLQISPLEGILTVGAGYEHSLFLKDDNSMWSCGKNIDGQLGDGTLLNSNVPVKVTGLCSIITSDIDIPEPPGLSAFPNPFTSKTTLTACNPFTEATLTLFNANGQQVRQASGLSGQTIDLDRENLPDGIYFVRLTQDVRVIATIRIIIIN